MLDALAIHEAAHAVINTVLGLSVEATFIDPTTLNGRTGYVLALSKVIEELLQAPSLDEAMKSLAEKVGIATAAGYVAEARHRGVPRKDICLTQHSAGYSDRELMKKLCAKLHRPEQPQFAKWEDEADKLITRHAFEIETVGSELRKKLRLTGTELESLITSPRECSSTLAGNA